MAHLEAFAGDDWGDRELVHAGGGIIVRPGPAGLAEILLVHRPKYDDWTLPKGKLSDEDEAGEAAAVREVEEETGLRCRIRRPVGSTRYVDHRGRDKVTRYWEMEAVGGSFAPNEEVDQVRWLTVHEALDSLSYDHDRTLVQSWEELATP